MLGRGMDRPVGQAGYVVCCLQRGARMGLWWVVGTVCNGCSMGAEAWGATNFVRSVR